MVGTARAKFRKAWRIGRIYETQNLFVVLNRGDETFLLRNLSTQPRQNRGESFVAFFLRERLIFLAAERFRVAALA